MKLAPIILFVYNRPDHTKKTIKALQKNKLAKDSELFIFSDAPRDKHQERNVKEVRKYIKQITGFKKIIISEKNKNWGLAKSIISGVTHVVNKYKKVIVLEDDLITSPHFLNYMNDALELHKKNEKVMHISGFFPVTEKKLPDTFFYNQTSCWGWATWERAWKSFNNDTEFLYKEIKNRNLIKKFNIDGSNPGFEQQLINNINKKIKTWAIKWQASVFLQNGLCLHPNKSLVRNIGFDGSGVNCKRKQIKKTKLAKEKITVKKIILSESRKARQAMKKYFNKQKPNILKKIKLHLQELIKT